MIKKYLLFKPFFAQRNITGYYYYSYNPYQQCSHCTHALQPLARAFGFIKFINSMVHVYNYNYSTLSICARVTMVDMFCVSVCYHFSCHLATSSMVQIQKQGAIRHLLVMLKCVEFKVLCSKVLVIFDNHLGSYQFLLDELLMYLQK